MLSEIITSTLVKWNGTGWLAQSDDDGITDDTDEGPVSTETVEDTATDTGYSAATGRKASGPSDISAHPNAGPAQPRLSLYPTTEKCGCKRSFRSAWFQQYTWLEYSVLFNTIFCFACRHFGTGVGEPSYTAGGFQNWKKAHFSDGGLPHKYGKICTICLLVKTVGKLTNLYGNFSDNSPQNTNYTSMKIISQMVKCSLLTVM